MNKLYLILASFLITSCVPVAIVGTTHQVSTSASDERSFGDIFDDNAIKTKIRTDLIAEEKGHLFTNTTVMVQEGRVLITGCVDNQDDIKKSSSIIWKVKGVTEVINELSVCKKSVASTTKDVWITNHIRSRLVFDKNVKSVNYFVDVHNQVVYLLGIAKDEAERDLVLELASTTSGVQKVVSHIILNTDKRRRK